ncbi:hypothetical protein NITMOv2_3702 [Nitrospira moscoviensis]|uniref:Uncharacterized protein n=1 Tax=Nitrospira moscoviensis TaxID=42253 RepID=A0A0K2GGX1_NITMO|nr:hypothetical protein NITMOv2_3702 [Nitrospira moscoviensis]
MELAKPGGTIADSPGEDNETAPGSP